MIRDGLACARMTVDNRRIGQWLLFPVDQLDLVISQDAEAFDGLVVENSNAVACHKV